MILTGDPLEWSVPDHVTTAVAIGVFDGVHRGHRRVIEQVVSIAERTALTPTTLTFDPHPVEVLDPGRTPRLLSTIGQRIEALSRAGAEIVGVLPFRLIREMRPETFAADVLGDRLNARLVAVGADFRFGLNRSGDIDTLRRCGRERGYEVMAVDLVADQGHGPISSSRIRAMLAAGDVSGAAQLLGHLYRLPGIVVEGDARGRSIGFPTANIAVDARLAVPADGVYSAWVDCPSGDHRAVVNIGVRPTFDGGERTIEAHLLDFGGDLYGKELELRFVERLRGEQKFGSIGDLVEQIRLDVDRARATLEEKP
jgi:riboflavin kinase/FMN adenylyltransferase